ncbi:MAG: acyl-CoA dehydrogenase family protein [Actinobacteria bacterium]|nr:acyl-CoA dehydrogenase family protein [Actinomycetota bacterium]
MPPANDPSVAAAPQPDTAAALRDAVDAVVARDPARGDRELLGALFDAGLAWVPHPVGLGGLGLPAALQQVVDERLVELGCGFDWMRNPMGVGMIGPAIARHGGPRHHALLRPMFTAEDVWCQLFSEPGAGSDLAAAATRAVRDGDEWVVDGQKVWTTSAHRARYGLLLARTDPSQPKHRGLSAFVLDMSSPGVEVRPLRQMTGGADFNEVYLTGCRIPDADRVGAEGDGWKVAVTTLMNERVAIGGETRPRGSGPIEFAVAAWRSRGHSESERLDALMRVWIDAEILRLGSVRAKQMRNRGAVGAEGSVLKLAQARLVQRIMSLATDLAGAHGMLVPGYDGATDAFTDAALYFLRSQATTIAGGTTEIMKNILGERVLGLPPEPRVDRDRAWNELDRPNVAGARAGSTNAGNG